MIANAKCQHCGNEFETDGTNRTEFCPHCGKETLVFKPAPAFAPKSAPVSPKKEKPKVEFATATLMICTVVLFLVGCGMIFDGCDAKQSELHPEAGAIRQITGTLEECLGVVVIALSLILDALVTLIRKP
jgi:DNA-directed RNA polymerase subunit RPC12/RpoP